MTHLLIVDDEAQFRNTLVRAVKAQGHLVTAIEDPASLIATIAVHHPNVVLLDIMFASGENGLEVCQRLRQWSSIPVIILSVREDEATKVQALDAGADDYIVKPFGIEELLARVRAVQRRMNGVPGSKSPVIMVNKLSIDLDTQTVLLDNQALHLTRQEYGVLKMLATAQGRIVTYSKLWDAIWNREDKGNYANIRNVVKRLRNKLGEDLSNPQYIITEGTMGYRLGF